MGEEQARAERNRQSRRETPRGAQGGKAAVQPMELPTGGPPGGKKRSSAPAPAR